MYKKHNPSRKLTHWLASLPPHYILSIVHIVGEGGSGVRCAECPRPKNLFSACCQSVQHTVGHVVHGLSSCQFPFEFLFVKNNHLAKLKKPTPILHKLYKGNQIFNFAGGQFLMKRNSNAKMAGVLL
jgi:hypothetical protein